MKKTVFFMLVLALLCGCQKNDAHADIVHTDTVQTESTTESVATTEAEAASLDPNIDAIDYNGDEICFVSRPQEGINFNLLDVNVTSLNGESINDAVYYRNAAVSEKYNINISVFESTVIYNVLNKAIMANDPVYDIGLPCISDAMKLGINGQALNLNTIPHINFENPWWNGNIIKNSGILGENYFAIGDLNLLAYEATGVMMFSKNLAEKNDIPNLYNTVIEGKWTYDLFEQYSKQIYSDLNGNGQYDEYDQYGFTCNGYGTDCFALSTDIVYVSTDNDGLATLTYSEEDVVDHISKIVKLINNENITLFADRPQYIAQRQEIPLNAFIEDRVLFYTESMSFMHQLRTMETNFGLLPFPKRNEEQDTYYSFVHNGASSSVVLPVTVQDQDQMGRIVEDLYYQSYVYVKPAYYESTITGKIVRDSESEDMLDFILRNTRSDLAQVIRGNGLDLLDQFRRLVDRNSTEVSSMLASKAKIYQKKLSDINDAIMNNAQ